MTLLGRRHEPSLQDVGALTGLRTCRWQLLEPFTAHRLRGQGPFGAQQLPELWRL